MQEPAFRTCGEAVLLWEYVFRKDIVYEKDFIPFYSAFSAMHSVMKKFFMARK